MKYTINVKAKVITDPPNNQTNPSKTLLFIILPPYILSRSNSNNLSINLNHSNYNILYKYLMLLRNFSVLLNFLILLCVCFSTKLATLITLS